MSTDLTALRAARKRFAAEHPADPRHGTLNFYNNYQCRCAWCNDANNRKRKTGSGKTGRVNSKRVETISEVLLHHAPAEIRGMCKCGYPVSTHAGMEQHRARMVSNAILGTSFDDIPRTRSAHVGSGNEVELHRRNHEAPCAPCMDYLDSIEINEKTSA